MRRRAFIAGLGSTVAAHAQQQSASQMRLVAVLSAGGNQVEPYIVGFRKRLAELGWQEGRNIKFEIRLAESNINRARGYAAELVAIKPDVFFADNTHIVQLILAKTRNIPMLVADDVID